MKHGERLTINVVDEKGKPLEPKEHLTKFINQCGVVARDNVSITLQEWNRPKKSRVGFTFVDKTTQKDCWRKLMEHFVLPPEYNKHDEDGNVISGGCERRSLVKEFALKKMGEAFRTFKKNLV
jgi:ribosomal protein L24